MSIKAASLLAILCAACGAEYALDPGLANPRVMSDALPDGTAPSQVLYLPPWSPDGVTARPLLAGVTYRVVIDGTVGLWRADNWSSVCAGEPFAGPRFPSRGENGPVGADAEWVWAWPASSPALCPNGAPVGASPQPKRRVVVRSGASLSAPAETAMTATHAYTYALTGTGAPVTFLVDDDPRDDDYGYFRIRIFTP